MNCLLAGLHCARIVPIGAPSALERLVAYFDTPALVPLVIDEPVSPICGRLWNDADDADDVVAVRITYVEAAAAIAQARRLGRLTASEQRDAIALLGEKWRRMQLVDVVAASGDRQLLAAWHALGLHTLDVNGR